MKISEETLKNISQLSKLGIHDDTKKKLIKVIEYIRYMLNGWCEAWPNRLH